MSLENTTITFSNVSHLLVPQLWIPMLLKKIELWPAQGGIHFGTGRVWGDERVGWAEVDGGVHRYRQFHNSPMDTKSHGCHPFKSDPELDYTLRALNSTNLAIQTIHLYERKRACGWMNGGKNEGKCYNGRKTELLYMECLPLDIEW
jgi:hypothetical protein